LHINAAIAFQQAPAPLFVGTACGYRSGMVAVDPTPALDGVEWLVAPGPLDYRSALDAMEARAAAIAAGSAAELIWLLEHAPVLTAGTSAAASELLDAGRFPVVAATRGGRYTYHGPGQRIVYVMLDLGKRGRDVRRFVHALENWAIAALSDLGVAATTSPAGIGIWTGAPGFEAKIGAIGVRVRRWVSLHGMALNVTTDLAAYRSIVPCGIADRSVTRLCDIQPAASMADLDAALRRHAASFLDQIPARAPLCLPHAVNSRLEEPGKYR
jgi:lipoyl(octanoyl) transferase